jgi:hypothetical protein
MVYQKVYRYISEFQQTITSILNIDSEFQLSSISSVKHTFEFL